MGKGVFKWAELEDGSVVLIGVFLACSPFPHLIPSAPVTSAVHWGRSGACQNKQLSPQVPRPWAVERAGTRTPPLSLPAGLECPVQGVWDWKTS